MSDKSFRSFVLCYLLGEWVAGVVLDRRARNRIRRDAAIRRQGETSGYSAGFCQGYQLGHFDGSGRSSNFRHLYDFWANGRSAVRAGDATVPGTRRYR